MFEVLRLIARINDELGRGASDDEVRAIAQRQGMDPRGLAGTTRRTCWKSEATAGGCAPTAGIVSAA